MAWFWFTEWLILVYIINRIIHGRLEIWNLSSRVHIRYLTRSLRSLVRYRCEHSKINSISPCDHVLFSIYPHWFLFVHPLGKTYCLHQSKRGRSYVWTGGGSKGWKRWQSTLWERDLKGIRWLQRQLCSERFEIGTSSMLVKVIAKEQPREDTRLWGSSLIEPCVIVPAYSNVRQHWRCNSEQRMHCFRANMWYRIHEPSVCANPLIRCDLLTKSSVKILPEFEIQAKILLLHAKSKIWVQKMDEFAIHCSCRIRKSVKMSLWIRNPGKNIFKIRWSIRLFTPLHEGPSRTWVGVCVLLAFNSWHKVHDNSWSTCARRERIEVWFPVNSSHMCCVELALKGVTLALKGLWDTSFPCLLIWRLCHDDEPQ